MYLFRFGHTVFVYTWLCLFLLFWGGCNGPRPSQMPSDCVDEASTYMLSEKTRGALMASRFKTLEELRDIIRLEFYPGKMVGAEKEIPDTLVRVCHCSSGIEIAGILAPGASEGDFARAKNGSLEDKIEVGVNAYEAIVNRRLLEQVLILSRWRPRYLGEGDPAFYDIADAMKNHILWPDISYKNARDSSEKGFVNTFNHMIAQAVMTSVYSEELADFIADVHERENMPELIRGNFTAAQMVDPNQNPVDNYIDIVNNEWGQELGKDLARKHGITYQTHWTPVLLADYLNDMQAYFGWALQVGMEPFRPEDVLIIRFAHKLNWVKGFLPL